jgi:hypothetical protein
MTFIFTLSPVALAKRGKATPPLQDDGQISKLEPASKVKTNQKIPLEKLSQK